MTEFKYTADLDLKRLADRRSLIRDEVHIKGRMLHEILDFDVLDTYVKLVLKCFRLTSKHEMALRKTISPFCGKELTREQADLLAAKLSGAHPWLKKGKAVLPFTGVSKPLWVPIELQEIRFSNVIRGNLFVNVQCLALGGPAVGVEFSEQMIYSYVTGKLARELAWKFDERKPRHSELVRMCFVGLLEKGERSPIAIKEVRVPGSYRKHNVKLRETRAEPCIRDYSYVCHRCPVGYEHCHRATHRYTLIRKPCPSCENDEAFWDPSQPHAPKCLACTSKPFRRASSMER